MSATVTTDDYPVQFEVDYARRHSRILLFLRWLLVVPHLFALVVLYLVSIVLTLVAAVSVLITRHYPRAIFNFNVGLMRWGWRVTAYMYMLTDRYPPFGLSAHESYPVRFRITYPSSVARWRVLFAWLVALPALLVAALLSYALGILALAAFVVILVTGRYPRAMFNFNIFGLRLSARANAYAGFMATRYPL